MKLSDLKKKTKTILWKFQAFPGSNILFLLCSRQDDDYFSYENYCK